MASGGAVAVTTTFLFDAADLQGDVQADHGQAVDDDGVADEGLEALERHRDAILARSAAASTRRRRQSVVCLTVSMPVAMFVAVTVAPGSAALEVSSTVP